MFSALFQAIFAVLAALPLLPSPSQSSLLADAAPDATAVAVADPFAPITSPDVGDHCADGLDASQLTEFFSEPIGSFQGADYQRAFRLGDGRVLWVFQDAFVSGTLVHNVGMVQSGRCFTMLNSGARSWLLGDLTSHMRRWHWIFDGALNADETEFHLFVVEMNETGDRYLSGAQPTALRRVVLDAQTLTPIAVVDEQPTGDDLYGWSVTGDAEYTYLYSHCYQQFGHDTVLGIAECAEVVKLARIPLGQFDAPREYWDGDSWVDDHTRAAAVVDGTWVFSGNNPAQIRFDGERFLLVEKRDDWWGKVVEFGVSEQPQGPFTHVASIDHPVKCAEECTTYFAAWLPWTDGDGAHLWSIGHNRWSGAHAGNHISTYRPTFHEIDL